MHRHELTLEEYDADLSTLDAATSRSTLSGIAFCVTLKPDLSILNGKTQFGSEQRPQVYFAVTESAQGVTITVSYHGAVTVPRETASDTFAETTLLPRSVVTMIKRLNREIGDDLVSWSPVMSNVLVYRLPEASAFLRHVRLSAAGTGEGALAWKSAIFGIVGDDIRRHGGASSLLESARVWTNSGPTFQTHESEALKFSETLDFYGLPYVGEELPACDVD